MSSSLRGFTVGAVAFAGFFGGGYVLGHLETGDLRSRVEAVEAHLGLKRVEVSREIALDPARMIGHPEAAHALVIYTDFECPYCISFHRTAFQEVVKEFVDVGVLRVGVKLLPIPSIHPFAESAAEAALCAAEHGRFFGAYDFFLTSGKTLSDLTIQAGLDSVGVSRQQFERCRASAASKIRSDVAEANDLGFSGTPSFVLGPVDAAGHVAIRERWTGFKTADQLRPMIRQLLEVE